MLKGSAVPRAQRGLSLVELMIGIAVALFILASASIMMAAQLGENRQLLLETKVDQELRAAAEVIVRDLRNAGFSQDASKQVGYLGARPNAYASLAVGTLVQPTTEVQFASAGADSEAPRDYSSVSLAEASGYKLQDQTIKVKIANAWQPLTDPNTVLVTTFNLSSIEQSCSTACPAGVSCPRQVIRTVRVTMAARAAHDSRVSRGFSTDVRVRNDAIAGSCPT